MIAEGEPGDPGEVGMTGYCVVAKESASTLKKVSGMSTGVEVVIVADENGTVCVDIGSKEMGKKGVAAGATAMILGPLAAAPAYGMYKQSALEKEVFDFIENYVSRAAPEALRVPTQAQVVSGQVVSSGQNARCASCGCAIDGSFGFCPSCGAPVVQAQPDPTCPGCGATVPSGTKFCPFCGQRIPQGNVCPSCGEQLQEGQRYCHNCGWDTLS